MRVGMLACAVAATAFFAHPAYADGGPVPEPMPEAEAAPAPEPEPQPEPQPAFVDEPAPAAGGFYAALGGGAAWLSDIDVDVTLQFIIIFPPRYVESDTGWALVGALGHDFGNGLRAELEVGYRDNNGRMADRINGITAGEGHVGALDVMANLLYGFGTGASIDPYVGAGIGTARVNAEFDQVDFDLEEAVEWAFAYQFIGGVNIPLPNTSAALFVDYRYLATTGLDLRLEPVFFNTDQYRTHTALGGVRFNF